MRRLDFDGLSSVHWSNFDYWDGEGAAGGPNQLRIVVLSSQDQPPLVDGAGDVAGHWTPHPDLSVVVKDSAKAAFQAAWAQDGLSARVYSVSEFTAGKDHRSSPGSLDTTQLFCLDGSAYDMDWYGYGSVEEFQAASCQYPVSRIEFGCDIGGKSVDASKLSCLRTFSFPELQVDDVRSIDFDNCTALLSANIRYLIGGDYGVDFHNCQSLVSANVEHSLSSSEEIFSGCVSLKGVRIIAMYPEGVPPNAFYDCASLTSVNCSQISAGESAFRNCRSLRDFPIVSYEGDFGVSAFDGCWSLTSVTGDIMSPTGGVRYAEGAFADCWNLGYALT